MEYLFGFLLGLLYIINSGNLINKIGRYYIPDVSIDSCESIRVDPDLQRMYTINDYNDGIDVMNYTVSDDLTSVNVNFDSFINFTNIIDNYYPSDLIFNITEVDITALLLTQDGYLLVTIAPLKSAQYVGYLVIINKMSLNIVKIVKLDECFYPNDVSVTSYVGKIVVICEGIPSEMTENPQYNPEASVIIIDYNTNLDMNSTVITFNDYNYLFDNYKFGVNDDETSLYRTWYNESFSVNIEPEFSLISDSDELLFVTLQEANGLAVISLINNTILNIFGLGFQSMNIYEETYNGFPSYGLDASDFDNKINITKFPNLYGMKLPDNMIYISKDNKHYIITVNEGDNKAFDQTRVMNLNLNDSYFTGYDTNELQAKTSLGRLYVSNLIGVDGVSNISNKEFNNLYTFSSRDYNVWEYNMDMNSLTQIYSSLNDFEGYSAELLGTLGFNSDKKYQPSFEARSDSRGPEPEGIAKVYCSNEDKTYIFIGFERVSGLIGYDISDINNPNYIEYFNDRNFSFPVGYEQRPSMEAGDVSPETIAVVDESYHGKPLLFIANTQSSSVGIYLIDCEYNINNNDNNNDDKNGKKILTTIIVILSISVCVGIIVIIVCVFVSKKKKSDEDVDNAYVLQKDDL